MQAIITEFYEKCSDITERYEKLCGRWEEDSQLFHVVSEVCELKDALRNKKEKYGKHGSPQHLLVIEDELADVFLTALATANYLGIGITRLNNALHEKLSTVEKRVNELENQSQLIQTNMRIKNVNH